MPALQDGGNTFRAAFGENVDSVSSWRLATRRSWGLDLEERLADLGLTFTLEAGAPAGAQTEQLSIWDLGQHDP